MERRCDTNSITPSSKLIPSTLVHTVPPVSELVPPAQKYSKLAPPLERLVAP
uniref:Uncharacterized protein LOC104227709 n=1 Tax=Nicotiana sylvestris TaxID=4096 RepID=A0A1U7WM09_NICSY|nr:PREDICTED: uncharacterized protein LOC104227709 [Nicotiana sylvestris]